MFKTIEALHDNVTNTGFYPLTHEQAVIGNDEVDLETKLKKINNDISKSLIDYSKEYLTTEALEDGTISFIINKLINTDLLTSISYSVDNGTTWTTINNKDDKKDNIQIDINVNEGDKILWKGNALALSNDNDCVSGFVSNIQINVYGNIMSLLYDDNFINQTSLPNVGYNFYELFSDNFNAGANIINTSNLILPATTLADNCYSGMFGGCKSLTTAPALPATTLASYCYLNMFNGCTSLTTTPNLPATTLAINCYGSMFRGCTSLTTAPELPATTLAQNCYANMFYGCTSLTTAPELPATTLSGNCYNGMFKNCTALTMAPELPATTLVKSCYEDMFNGCTSLNYIKCLATNALTIKATYHWVIDVSSIGTFIKVDNMASWAQGDSDIPLRWTVYTESEYELVRKHELNEVNNNSVHLTEQSLTVEQQQTVRHNIGASSSLET